MDVDVKDLPFIKCPLCDKALVEGRWTKSKGKKALLEHLKKVISLEDIVLESVNPDDAFEGKLPKKISVHISTESEDGIIELDIPIKTKTKHCDICRKVHGQYFEGYLQIRDATDSQIEFVKSAISKKGAIKKESIKNGSADFTISSNKAIIYAMKELQSTYTGIATITSTLHTRDKLTSKDLYRVTGLFRFIQFNKGEIVSYEDDFYLVVGIDKKKFTLSKISTQSMKKVVPIASVDQLSKIDSFETSIIREKPIILVLDENFQPSPAFLFEKLDKKSKSHKAIRTKEGLFVLN